MQILQKGFIIHISLYTGNILLMWPKERCHIDACMPVVYAWMPIHPDILQGRVV